MAKKRARKKAATKKSAAIRRSRSAVAKATSRRRKAGTRQKKRTVSKRHGPRSILRPVSRRKKSGVKASDTRRAIRKPTPQRVSKGSKSSRLVRRTARASPSLPIRATGDDRTQLKNALDVIRKHVKGYESKSGYALNDVVRFTKARQRAILKKSAQIKELLASPHDIIRPKNDKEKRALRPFARKQLRGAKHYIVHKPSDESTVSLRAGRVRITRRQGRVEIDTIYFMFPHAPQGEDDAIEMLEDMLPEMPDGFYIMQTGAHGDTGEPAEKSTLIEKLRRYINDYQMTMVTVYDGQGNEVGRRAMDTGFTEAVLGFRFSASYLDGAIIDKRNVDIRRQKAKEYNEHLRKRNMTDVEKLEAKAEWARKRGRQKRKAAQKKSAKRRAVKKKPVVRTVGRSRKVVKKKARAKK